jgi:succinate dehydrogenase cytochrome b556 subunit/succinate dehydrogenase hydrophobic membrane anchor protein
MKANTINSRSGGWVMPLLEKVPFLSDLARSRGWHYVISWCHRISGVGLVFYLLYHIYTLSSLQTPAVYDGKMKLLAIPIVVFLAWLSCLPVVFHALNGGRLILYESFGSRNDETMVRWTFGLTALYAAVFGLLILLKNQSVSPFFFWLLFLLAALLSAYGVGSRLRRSGHTLYWKLQRITGAFLLVAIPAHLMFSHLNPGVAHEAQAVILRMQSVFIKIVDIILAVSALYHAGYGLFSIGADYIRTRSLRRLYTAAVAVVAAGFLFIALRLTVSV